jgi:hypothetical protein
LRCLRAGVASAPVSPARPFMRHSRAARHQAECLLQHTTCASREVLEARRQRSSEKRIIITPDCSKFPLEDLAAAGSSLTRLKQVKTLGVELGSYHLLVRLLPQPELCPKRRMLTLHPLRVRPRPLAQSGRRQFTCARAVRPMSARTRIVREAAGLRARTAVSDSWRGARSVSNILEVS